MNASSSELLILELHGRLLRTFAVEVGQHFQGLAQSARFLKRSGRISAATANKLLKLDSAFNLVRHITAISVCRFEADLVSELLNTSLKANSTVLSAGDSTRSTTLLSMLNAIPGFDIAGENQCVVTSAVQLRGSEYFYLNKREIEHGDTYEDCHPDQSGNFELDPNDQMIEPAALQILGVKMNVQKGTEDILVPKAPNVFFTAWFLLGARKIRRPYQAVVSI